MDQNISNYVKINALVVGFGFSGAGAALAFLAHDETAKIKVIEKGAKGDHHGLDHRDGKSSQGGRRGSRKASQNEKVAQGIDMTSFLLESLQEETKIDIIGRTDNDKHPYFMMMPREQLESFLQHLIARPDKNGKVPLLGNKEKIYRVYDPTEVKERFGINIPHDYVAVNTLESRLIHTNNYMQAATKKIEAASKNPGDDNDNIKYETSIVDYVKLKGGGHLVELSDGNKYHVDNLVLAPGMEGPETLKKLTEMHETNRLNPQLAASLKMEFAPPARMPEEFKQENLLEIRQQVIEVIGPERDPKSGSVRKPTLADLKRRESEKENRIEPTVYYLDVVQDVEVVRKVINDKGELEKRKETEKWKGLLGFYMFPVKVKAKVWDEETSQHVEYETLGFKIGFDPMRCTVENPELYEKQVDMMLRHLSETFGVKFAREHIVNSTNCRYYIGKKRHHTRVGFIDLFTEEETVAITTLADKHDTLAVLNPEGYGPMLVGGAVFLALKGEQAIVGPDSPFNPHKPPEEAEVMALESIFRPDATMAAAPSDGRSYGRNLERS